MAVARGLSMVALCTTALAISCVATRQAPDEPEPVIELEVWSIRSRRSIAVVELLYAAHEKHFEPEYMELLSAPAPDFEIVRLLANQVPHHKRFFWQKAKDDFRTADFVLCVCPLVPEFEQEIAKLPRGALTTEAKRQAWLRVLEREEPE